MHRHHCFSAIIHYSNFKSRTHGKTSVCTGLSDFILISYIDLKFICIKLNTLGEVIQIAVHRIDTTRAHHLKNEFLRQGIYLL